MSHTKNLYLITGKGGVGKTTVSLALTRYLQEQGQDVYYSTISSSSLNDRGHPIQNEEFKKLGIKHLELHLMDCVEDYVARKLKSKIIAKAVVKTPFFRSLINMIPGFSYLIFVGKILETIHDNNNKITVVFDAPASGHTLTLLEATQNFNDIFKSGMIFEDTNKMLTYLHDPQFLSIHVISTLTEMSMVEGSELIDKIEALQFKNTHLISNNALSEIPHLKEQPNLPEFLKAKIKLESEIRAEFKDKLTASIPHILSTKLTDEIKDLAPYMQNLV